MMFTRVIAMFRRQTIILICLLGTLSIGVPVSFAYISNGGSAIDAIGQYDDVTDPEPIYTKAAVNDGPNRFGLNTNYGGPVIDTERHRLFVSDSTNNRILVYNLNTDNTLIDHIADYVLGPSNFYTSAAGAGTTGLNFPLGIAYVPENDLILVADHLNNRVLAFDAANLSSGMSASFAIGQPDLTTTTGRTTQSGMRVPWGVSYSTTGSLLFVGDRDNNRVLVYSGALTAGMDAWRVIGQSTFTASGSAVTQAGLNNPRGLTYDSASARLFVTDHNNNRVLVYTGSALTNGMNANHVLGQSSYVVNTSATTQAGFWAPLDVVVGSGNILFVADATNHRIKLYDVASITNNENAVGVLCQTLYTTRANAATAAGCNGPRGIGYDPGSRTLFNAEAGYHRVTFYDVASVTNGESAVDMLGQYDDSVSNPQPVYSKTIANNGPNKFGLNNFGAVLPSVEIDEVNHRLFVTDSGNLRILVYNLDSNNELIDYVPDYVLGQQNFYSRVNGTTRALFGSAQGLAYDSRNNRLFVVADAASRVLVYDFSSGISSGMSGSYVLGQTNFTAATAATSRTKLNFPYGAEYDEDNDRLFIGDNNGNRIMVYVFTGGVITNGQSGSYVLGQPSFTVNTARTTATGLRAPRGSLQYDSDRDILFVSDANNNRVMGYDLSLGITSGMSGTYVLGQQDFTSSGSAVISAATVANPRGLAYDSINKRLFLGDTNRSRILVFDMETITSGEDAVSVIGQTNFTDFAAGTTISTISGPRDLAYDSTNDRLYIQDTSNNRLLLFDVGPDVASSSSSSSSVSSSSSSEERIGGGRRGGVGRGGETPAPITDRYSPQPSGNEGSPDDGSTDGGTDGGEDGGIDGPDDLGERAFSDVPTTTWFASAIEEVEERNIFTGYEDEAGNKLNVFGANDPITIGQVIKVALLTAGINLPIPAGIPMNETATDWSAPYVALAESRGLTVSSDDVHKNATRGEVVRALLEAFNIGFAKDLRNQFTDLDPSDPNAAAILTAEKLGIITGDTNEEGERTGTFRPNDPINRAEVAVLVTRMLGLR